MANRMKTKTRLRKSKVTTITMARLYSLGNYEHIRFEITAAVPEGGSAKATLLDLGSVLARLKPVKKPYNYDAFAALARKPIEQMTEVEKANLVDAENAVAEYLQQRAAQFAALEKLDALGGTSKHTDGQGDWREEGNLPF